MARHNFGPSRMITWRGVAPAGVAHIARVAPQWANASLSARTENLQGSMAMCTTSRPAQLAMAIGCAPRYAIQIGSTDADVA